VGQHNIIELNGKQYDAVTGAFLGEGRIKATPEKRVAMNRSGRNIDGFMLKPKTITPPPDVVKPTVKAAEHVQAKKSSATAAARKITDVQRGTTQTIKPHQPERPQTLMRHVVKKPKTTMKPAIKTAAPTEMMARPTSTLAKPLEKKLSVTQVNPQRLARSRHVAKSHHIRRFKSEKSQQRTHATATGTQNHPAAIPAQARSIAAAAQPQVPAQHYQATTVNRKLSHSIALAKAKQQLALQQKRTDMFESALANAVSHEQLPQQHTKRSRAHRRLVNIVAGVGAFLVLGGFLAYLNMSSIELQVASFRAGFHAEMPNYQPTGYAINGGIKSSKGEVSMEFRSGTSAYKITQRSSDWNSATLLDQENETRGEPSQTIQSKGRIIYIYDGTSAAWVNGGVHYEITGNAELDADELVAVATSM
jgi:hypothetical protein